MKTTLEICHKDGRVTKISGEGDLREVYKLAVLKSLDPDDCLPVVLGGGQNICIVPSQYLKQCSMAIEVVE